MAAERAFARGLRDGIRELTSEERAAVWRRCAADPELRFYARANGSMMRFGGWRGCLRKVTALLAAQGRALPPKWEESVEFLRDEG